MEFLPNAGAKIYKKNLKIYCVAPTKINVGGLQSFKPY